MVSKFCADVCILIFRPKNNYDLSLPSGNSVASCAMYRLYCITHEEKYLSASKGVMHSQAQAAAENPFGFGYMLNLIYAYLQKPLEITITGTQSRDISSRLAREFLPESILISISDMPTLKPLLEYAFFTGKEFGEKSLAYVCQDSTCSPPVYTAQQVLDLVK